MTKKIQCQPIFNGGAQNVKVKIIKAPLVDTIQLRSVITQRARAVVL